MTLDADFHIYHSPADEDKYLNLLAPEFGI